MTTQLTLTGTPQELADVLEFLNGKSSKAEKASEPAKGKGKIVQQTLPLEDENEEITVDALRLIVQEKAKAGKRDAVKKILKDYGAASVTELDESDYADVKAAIEKL